MLQLLISGREFWDEEQETFVRGESDVTLQLEHSLISISKWEVKWQKPFLDKKHDKTWEESIDYIRCMTITQNVPEDVYLRISQKEMDEVIAYIERPMTARKFYTFGEEEKVNNEVITYELIYYWMIALNIPIEFQKWHLNRLLTLIKLCNIKNGGSKKLSNSEIMRRNTMLNQQRRAKHKTRG